MTLAWPLCLQGFLCFSSHCSWIVPWKSRVASLCLPHVPQSLPLQHPAAFLSAKFVFVREDASIPSLAPLYRGLYLVLQCRDKFFHLQIGFRTDVVSVDWIKPLFSDESVSPAIPPTCGRPAYSSSDSYPPTPCGVGSASSLASCLSRKESLLPAVSFCSCLPEPVPSGIEGFALPSLHLSF